LKETSAPTKNLEETPQTDPPVVAIAADPTPTPAHHPEVNKYVAPTPAIDPTPTPVHHPEINQYVAPTPSIVATSAPTYPGHAEAPMFKGVLVPLLQRVDAPTLTQCPPQYAVTPALPTLTQYLPPFAAFQYHFEMGKATSILSKYLPSYTGKQGRPTLEQFFPQYEFAHNNLTIAQYLAQYTLAPDHPNLQFPEQRAVARDHPLLARYLPRQMASQYHGQMAEAAQHLPEYAVAFYHPTPIHYFSPFMASSYRRKMAVAQYGGSPPMDAICLI
jgi:hypothetical protein